MSNQTHAAFQPFATASGLTLKNRIVKAVMEENLANADQHPDKALCNLYSQWAFGGVGLIITGNVMIDHLAMTGPGGVALEEGADLTPFKTLANKAQQNDCKVMMQINHPGRQVFKKMGGKILSPSDVALNMGKHSNLFAPPTPMTEQDIADVKQRFVTTAMLAQQAGYDGVQIHAAHGYLLAQFLSPLTNKRSDQWGGSLENRARLLLDVVRSVKQACGERFALSVKLNSADFQRGGFDVDDAKAVVVMLEEIGVDFVELSGGSYEAPAMRGRTADDRTLAREAYFLEFAEQILPATDLTLMTTGGISRLATADAVIDSGISLVGIASALAMSPDLVNQWHANPNTQGYIPKVTWKDKTLAGLATMGIMKRQLQRMSDGRKPKHNDTAFWSLILSQIKMAKLTKRYRKRYADEVNDV
ncbi:NADH:flavin oxidoreductase/NADH oxidase family protein [Alteromonas sp. ASW11-36]|uniref:NADH:flavin oxidoreductase/NADH oxidase family protein n=1 Tax=Alteromonas arenosi TaxID=3055817 RepID=A0ABT7SWN5_9ALTE|nr:NADH:flavin oxidoreductase/NADH oxidase family protein [Alteromonas sp. ASW11-36]MDM7860565.1 NADH:flavin oxidoreductase/NADH oxidase family protein [Alteromonas sp. ASW11-36]